MRLAEGIRKLGFCKWHERELFSAFAWMALALLGAIVAFTGLEALWSSRGWPDYAKSAFVLAGAGVICIAALQRFVTGLAHAQQVGAQAMCGQCETFGQLQVLDEARDHSWVRVRCRRCEHAWVIDDA